MPDKEPMIRTKEFRVIKPKAIPEALAQRMPSNDGGFWIYASREIVDSSGDVVTVDGLDLMPYHNPPETHLKVLAQHLRVLPDGTPPVVGIVTDHTVVNSLYGNSNVKSLALYVEWLKDKEGKLLPLSQIYKDMMDAQGIDSGSVGMMVEEYAANDTGGLNITKAKLFEFSLVTLPDNVAATIVKMGYTVAKEEIKETDHPYKRLTVIEGQCDKLVKSLDALVERFDTLESLIVVQSTKAAQPTDDHNPERAKESIKDLSKRMDTLLDFLGK